MFELMDTTSDRAILTVISTGSKYSEILEKIDQSKVASGLDFMIDDIRIASNNKEDIKKAIGHSDMLILVCNMAYKNDIELTSTIAEISKEIGILTAIIGFNGETSHANKQLIDIVDSLLIISDNNNNLNINHCDVNKSVILQAMLGLSEMIYRPGLIRVDFADVRTILSNSGIAKMGFGTSYGEERAKDATELALASQALKEVDFFTINGLLITVRAGMDLSIGEFEDIGNIIKQLVSDECTVVLGTIIERDLPGEMQVIIVCAGVSI